MAHIARRGRSALIATAAPALICALMPSYAAAQDSSRSLTAAYNASGQDLFKRLAAAPGNIVFSPYSIGSAMAMVLAGARGGTEREMVKALRQRLAPAQINDANAAVLARLDSYDKGSTPPCPPGLELKGSQCVGPLNYGRCPEEQTVVGDSCVAMPNLPHSAKLAVANALMLTRSDSPVSNDYVSLLADKYAAEVFRNATLDSVNGWVARKTEGKIDKILDRLDQDTAAVILNAVYFKAKWASVFHKEATRDEPFNLTRTQRISAPTMRRTGNYALVSRQGYRALRLAYDVDALGMIVVLPNDIDGLAATTARLDAREFEEVAAALRRPASGKQVELTLPRFKITTRADLVPPLKQAGMTLAFDSAKADFSGITGRPPSELPTAIGQILHRAFIDVMEDGTEAAAATAATISVTSAPAPQQIVPFHVDHPFLYFIVDDATGAILFEGRVVDPR